MCALVCGLLARVLACRLFDRPERLGGLFRCRHLWWCPCFESVLRCPLSRRTMSLRYYIFVATLSASPRSELWRLAIFVRRHILVRH